MKVTPKTMTPDAIFLCNQIAEWNPESQQWVLRTPLPILPSIPLDETADVLQISIDFAAFAEALGLKFDNVAIPSDKTRLFVYGLRVGKKMGKLVAA